MGRKSSARDKLIPRKSTEELDRVGELYRKFEPLLKSPFPGTEDIGDEDEMKPIIVHSAKGRPHREK